MSSSDLLSQAMNENGPAVHVGEQGQFRLLFERSSDAIWLLEPIAPWTILNCNSSACRMHGYSREELIGQPISMLSSERAKSRPSDQQHQPVRAVEVAQAEDVHRHKDGRLIYVEYSTAFVTVEGRELLLGIDRDITARKEAEEALHRSEERFQFAARATHDAFWDFDLTSERGWWSEAYTTIFGHPHGIVPPGTWEDCIHPDDRERVLQNVDTVLNGDSQFWVAEYRFRRGDGSFAHVIDRAYVVRDASNRALRIIGALMDDSARKEAERGLVAAKEIAERANLAKTEFLSRMSHELRTPLTTILGYGQLLEQELTEYERQQQAGFIVKAGEYLLGLINDMLDLSRIETARLAFQIEPVPLATVARNLFDLVRPVAEAHRISLRAGACMDDDVTVLADPQRLRQILLNLLMNAIKYNSPEGTVTLDCVCQRSRVRLLVQDSGPGLAAGEVERLFVPFERLDAAKRGITGIGLGLALSRQLAEMMDGTLGVESAVGEGSTFWVDLPAAMPNF